MPVLTLHVGQRAAAGFEGDTPPPPLPPTAAPAPLLPPLEKPPTPAPAPLPTLLLPPPAVLPAAPAGGGPAGGADEPLGEPTDTRGGGPPTDPATAAEEKAAEEDDEGAAAGTTVDAGEETGAPLGTAGERGARAAEKK
jgi:hypothetical protein